MRKLSRKMTIIASTMALVVVTSVVAYAFWTNSGAGSGNAQTGSNTVTVTQRSSVTGLVPGGPAVALSGDFDNPNTTPVFVNTVTASLVTVTGGAGDLTRPPCTTADFALEGTNPVPIGRNIPVGSGVDHWSGPTIRLRETGLDQDNCKSVNVQINYAVT